MLEGLVSLSNSYSSNNAACHAQSLYIHTSSKKAAMFIISADQKLGSGMRRTPSNSFCKAFKENDFLLQKLSERKLVKEEKACTLPKRSFSNSWLKPACCRPPLTKEEEQIFSQDVQDLLYIEKKKEELQKRRGRNPSDQELADFIGCSIYHFYARVGKGRAARRKMIAANLPLVASIAKRFHGKGLSQQELCQEGVMGLFKSSEKFCVIHNTKFSTYSFFWIFERMSAAVDRFRNILPLGKSQRRTLSSVLQCKDEFREQHGRNPTMDELANASEVNKMKIRRAFSVIRPAKSFDANFSNDYLGMMHNVLMHEFEDPESDCLPWSGLWKNELKTELSRMLAALTSRELQVLRLKYGLDGEDTHTLFQVAATLGLSHETVRKAEKNAIRKLKESATNQHLQQYLDKTS